MQSEKKHHRAKQVHRKRGNLHAEHKPSDEIDLLIEAVNEADLGWTADVCKYQKHHSKYGAHCDQDGTITFAQTNSDDVDDGSESLVEQE